MVELHPEKFPQDAWNVYYDHIGSLLKDRLTRMSGPTGCKKHYWAVLDKVQDSFLRNFSESLRRENLVQSRSARVRSFTRTRKTPQSEAFWRKISIPSLVDRVVEDFVKLERKTMRTIAWSDLASWSEHPNTTEFRLYYEWKQRWSKK